MVRKAVEPPRREESLSKERIVEAAVALLDEQGEDGLTFRALAQRLATGSGAIYWHVANKSELLTAACDTVVAGALAATRAAATPRAGLRALALAVFDAIDAHPWAGSALARAPGELPTVRLLDAIGQRVQALGVRRGAQWAGACALLNYVLGVSGQNAANAQLGRALGLDRDAFLAATAARWAAQDEHPFVRSVAADLRDHDDRADFLAGIDLLLAGLRPAA